MFEQVIASLNRDLGTLRTQRKKIEDLTPRLTDREKKNRLATEYDRVCHTIDRVATCLSILNNEASLEISGDFKVVRLR